MEEEWIHYPIMIHGVWSSFRGGGLLKVLQLLHQLLTEAFLKHWEAIHPLCFNRHIGNEFTRNERDT